MKTKTLIILLVSHIFIGAIGFAAGIYALPILTAPPAPTAEMVSQLSDRAVYQTEFIKELQGSDFLHQAQGPVSVGTDFISFMGSISPGPDYMLYLSPEFVETKADFLRLKDQMSPVSQVKTFENFIVDVPQQINVNDFNTVVVWCESFNQFITAAQYK
jgi:hypothetical protein